MTDIAVGQEFWFVATGFDTQSNVEQDKMLLLDNLKQSPVLTPAKKRSAEGDEVIWPFDTLDGDRALTFGSFDNLIRLTDDLAKFDGQLDTIVHRMERQYLELLPKAEFEVQSHNKKIPFSSYFMNWRWDEAKYPRSRSISDTFGYITQNINKLDEECRNKTAQLNELKTQHTNVMKKDGQLLTNRDLVDVLTPEVVQMKGGSPTDDFIYTEHFTTVVVILPRGAEVEFLKDYETFVPDMEGIPMIVPMSAKCFELLTDKEGNMLYRVVLLKPGAEAFKKACREKRYIIRDFEYDAAAYKTLCKQREEISEHVARQQNFVTKLMAAAWSDATVGMLHIKAMRVFVESVLRFGMPAKFASFVVKPKAGAQAATRKALADVLGSAGSYGAADGGDDGEEYFPYVSFSFTPFTVPRV